MKESATSKILVIRRDNIGDLVCTTPLIRSLRRQLPVAHIEVLVTRYNKTVLQGNTDLDALHFYTKAKHREPDESLLGIYSRRLGTVLALRRQRFDWVLLPGGANASTQRFAKWIAPSRILAQNAEDQAAGQHEVEQCCHLLVRMGLEYETPAVRVVADQAEVARVQKGLPVAAKRLVGLHISARKPSQRWPADRFASLAWRIHEMDPDTSFLLLWAPGNQDNPLHPGDDEKAEAVLAGCSGLPILPVPTQRLEELIGALSLCETVICCDGGAMHLAAGLGKPIVALFGQSGTSRWRPWGVPQVVLQKPSLDVTDIDVNETFSAYVSLRQDI